MKIRGDRKASDAFKRHSLQNHASQASPEVKSSVAAGGTVACRSARCSVPNLTLRSSPAPSSCWLNNRPKTSEQRPKPPSLPGYCLRLVPSLRPHGYPGSLQHIQHRRPTKAQLRCDLACAHASAVVLDDHASVCVSHPTPCGRMHPRRHRPTGRPPERNRGVEGETGEDY